MAARSPSALRTSCLATGLHPLDRYGQCEVSDVIAGQHSLNPLATVLDRSLTLSTSPRRRTEDGDEMADSGCTAQSGAAYVLTEEGLAGHTAPSVSEFDARFNSDPVASECKFSKKTRPPIPGRYSVMPSTRWTRFLPHAS